MTWSKSSYYDPTLVSPPDEPEPRIVHVCIWCDVNILEDDTYYLIYDEPVCEDCINKARRTAEVNIEDEEEDY